MRYQQHHPSVTLCHASEQPPLSLEQQRFLELMSAGLTDREVAAAEYVSYKTVQRRIKELMDAYGIRTRHQLGAESIRRGWVKVPSLTG